MVTCGRQPFNMLPMAPINPFVVGLTPTSMAAAAAAAAAAVAESTTRSIGSGTATTTVATATVTTANIKPKLAFSIDSIVGSNSKKRDDGDPTQTTTNCRPIRPTVISPPLSSSQRSDSPDERPNGERDRDRLLLPYERPPSRVSLSLSEDSHHCQQPLELRNSFTVNYRSTADLHHTALARPPMGLIYCRRRSILDQSPERDCASPLLVGRCRTRSRSRSPTRLTTQTSREPNITVNRSRTPSLSPTPPHSRATPQSPQTPGSASGSIGELNKRPIHVPGIPAGLIRPLPMQAPQSLSLLQSGSGGGGGTVGPGGAPNSLEGGNASVNPAAVHPLAPTIPGSVPPAPPQPHGGPPLPPSASGVVPPPPPPPNPHFLAAQFQMAAALAHHHHQQQQQQQQHHHPAAHLPPGHPMALFPPGPHHPHFGGPHLIRDSYPLYPWLLSRHGRIFPHRFPGSKFTILYY
ncbi:homeotic protein empty spiracles-like [Rhagoletis pomonella]|uniref:homeotic protein empty spiracles-like n=1 Tax=Rhagoletis pomonella TaxID=28610 RepID=UPI0017873AFB|nr:homeotic protein empty spiracles-like [Rhagoletis pomonella]